MVVTIHGGGMSELSEKSSSDYAPSRLRVGIGITLGLAGLGALSHDIAVGQAYWRARQTLELKLQELGKEASSSRSEYIADIAPLQERVALEQQRYYDQAIFLDQLLP